MVLRAGNSPGPYTQSGIGVPSEKAEVRCRCFPGHSALLPMGRVLSPRKSLTFSFMLPYSHELMIVDISLDCVGFQRPLWGTLVRLARPPSLMFPYSRKLMIVLRRSLYGVVSDGSVLGLFDRLPPAVLTGFPQGAKISLEARFGRIVFLSAVFVMFHSRYQSTLIPVPLSIRPSLLQVLCPHNLFLGSKGWILPRPLHPT